MGEYSLIPNPTVLRYMQTPQFVFAVKVSRSNPSSCCRMVRTIPFWPRSVESAEVEASQAAHGGGKQMMCGESCLRRPFL